jgi:hypothetical protein
MGGVVLMNGMATDYLMHKQQTIGSNSTVTEIFAANTVGKRTQWIQLFMLDLGIPYTSPIPMGEDNSTT